MHYDVVVAGGGPAGSSAARDLARAGIKVLVLEEHAQIGRPLHCSGFVTPRTLTLAGVGDGMVVSQVKGAVVHGPGGARLELGGDKVRAHVLDRPQFDALLVESAQEAGAELLLQSKLACIERVNGHLALEVQRNGQRRQVTTSLLIGADGARSTVARWMGQSPKEVIWAVGAEVELAEQPSEMAQVFVGRTVAPDWFGWTIPIAPGRARIGIGVPYTNGNTKPMKPRHCLDRMVEAFPEQFRGFSVISFSGGFIPLYSSIRTYGDRALLVGDAACQVKPTSGGGIYTSLVAGRLAARTALEALGAGDTSAKYLARYEKAWRRAFGAELERGLDVRRIYKHLGDAELKRVMGLLRLKPLQSIIQRDGDIDYPSRMFGFLALASPQLRGLQAMFGFLSSSWSRLLGRPR
ncbi:MAG: NAD(P)/FAD-dependent oxidoreductase [Chloroflexi bacterium]|nr:NAD(P)/FAD-dependent oxidoreductase [Chloroflexota bacterium]